MSEQQAPQEQQELSLEQEEDMALHLARAISDKFREQPEIDRKNGVEIALKYDKDSITPVHGEENMSPVQYQGQIHWTLMLRMLKQMLSNHGRYCSIKDKVMGQYASLCCLPSIPRRLTRHGKRQRAPHGELLSF